MDENEMPMQEVLTKNSKMCGQPGEFILVPPSFFVSPDAVAKYGDKGKNKVRLALSCILFIFAVSHVGHDMFKISSS